MSDQTEDQPDEVENGNGNVIFDITNVTELSAFLQELNNASNGDEVHQLLDRLPTLNQSLSKGHSITRVLKMMASLKKEDPQTGESMDFLTSTELQGKKTYSDIKSVSKRVLEFKRLMGILTDIQLTSIKNAIKQPFENELSRLRPNGGVDNGARSNGNSIVNRVALLAHALKDPRTHDYLRRIHATVVRFFFKFQNRIFKNLYCISRRILITDLPN
jgi:hypothetical protein